MKKALVISPRKAQAEALRVKYAAWSKHNNLPPAIPEFHFHHARKWAFDFAYPEHLVAVEVEGAIWSRGRHTRGSGYLKDLQKYNAAASLGWRVLRIDTQGVFTEMFATTLRSALEYGQKPLTA